MDDVAARIRLSFPGAIERGGQPGREGGVVAFCWVGRTLRRHRPDGQLAHDPFPDGRVLQEIVNACRLEVHRILGWVLRAVVVTADAILVQPRALFGSLGRWGRNLPRGRRL